MPSMEIRGADPDDDRLLFDQSPLFGLILVSYTSSPSDFLSITCENP